MFTQGILRRILMAGDNLYEKMEKSNKERGELMAQLAAYKKRIAPYDLQFEPNSSPMIWWYCVDDALPKDHNHIAQLATKLFSITPHAAACERIWSSLGWFYGKRRTRLCLEKVEKMQKLAAFYLTNVKKELPSYGNGKTNEELQSILRDANLYEDDELEAESDDRIDDIYISEGSDNIRKDIIHLNQILNLDAPEILKDLDKLIEDLNIDLEEETNDDDDVGNDTVEADSAEEDWDPNLAVEAYL